MESTLPVLQTLAVGVATLAIWYTISRWRQRKKYPPGPYPWPVIGNLTMIMDDKKKIWEIITELQKEYGDLFTFFYAGEPTVILGNLDLVREAFLTKQNDFAGRPNMYSFDILSKGGKDIVFGQFGPVWRRQRKIVHAAMRQFASGDFLAKTIYDSTRKGFGYMDKEAESGNPVNPKHHLETIMYNILCSMVFGKTFEHEDPFFRNFIAKNEEFNEICGSGLLADFFPLFKYVPTKGQSLMKEISQFMFKIVEETYEEHEKTYNESHLRDFVDYMLQSCKETKETEGKAATDGLELDHYRLSVMDIFFAGTDTSIFTLWWSVLYMTAYPEVQKKLQDEVDAIVDNEEALQIAHRAQLPYTEAFLHEVMRSRPLAPLSLPHTTICDTSVGGYNIPKDTMVMPNYWAIHMNPEYWDEPEAFKPDRFLGNDGKMGPCISSWLPFSTGRRVCVGETVAKTQLHLTLASLIQRYNFAASPGVTMNVDIKTRGQVMIPEDYEVVISKRT